jgi:type I restriction-modification system DNA methylase subunit
MILSQENRKERFSALITEYQKSKANGQLDLSSEETIRTWLNEMLGIFGWDVKDTSQILQEKVLSKEEKAKLVEIGSTNIKPDYTFRVAKQKLTFLDAKDITVNLKSDIKAAYQIKSYGWSILAPCAFISNFEQLAIYDCGYMPKKEQPADYGRIYLSINDYIDNFELIDDHLFKTNIYSGKLNELYSKVKVEGAENITPDLAFANFLSDFRVDLASNILAKNEDMINGDSAQLGYLVQVIINRILFIRVCESRKLEDEGLLNSFAENNFWKSFKDSSYLEFFNHYDGPLFDRIEAVHDLTIDDAVFTPLLEYLYYPSPYRFDVIPTKLLSDIYEIFLSKKLIIKDGIVGVQWKPEYIKSKGAISTPQFLVRDIIKKTLTKNVIADEGIEKLISFKALDIACGSGVFLIELLDYLEELMIELHNEQQEEEFNDLFFQSDYELLLNLKGKKVLIDNCIFGIDVDAEAVEVAKMSLALKIVDNEDHPQISTQLGLLGEQILNGVGRNIRCGNSLVDNTVLTKYPDILNDDIELFKTNAFDWKTDPYFKKIFKENGGFDFVVGNPPYVEIKHFKEELPYMHKFINDTYVTGNNGKLDLAVPFIERSLSVLNDSGRLGFVIQKRFFKTEYGSKIREFITTNNYLASITDFISTSIFKGRLTYLAILVLDKSGHDNFYYHLVAAETETIPSYLRDMTIPEIEGSNYSSLDAKNFNHKEWAFDCFNIRNRLLANGKLGDYVKLKGGPQALKNAAYHIKAVNIQDGIITGSSQWADNIEIEVDACRPLFCNEHFYAFRPDTTATYVIFPYDIIDGQKRDIPYDEFYERFPLSGAYLESQKGRLEGPRGTAGGVETMPLKHPDRYTANFWHLYTRPNNLTHIYPKVFIPMTALDTFATLSSSDLLYADNANMWFVQIPEVDESKLYAIGAIINSTLFSVLARSIANPQDAGYFKFNKQFLEPIPFPKDRFLNDEELRGQISDKAKQIVERQYQYAASGTSRKNVIRGVLNQLWSQLDELVYLIYDVTQEERTFFNERGRNVNRVDFLNQWV